MNGQLTEWSTNIELRKKAEVIEKEIRQKNAPADQSTTRQIVISLLVPEKATVS